MPANEIHLGEDTRIRTNSGVAIRVLWTVIGLVAGGATMYSGIANDVHNLQQADIARNADMADMRKDVKMISRQLDKISAYIEAHQEHQGSRPTALRLVPDDAPSK